MKNRKGITLVALIVTIIILLILAGVSIATLTESGLFDKARQAKQKSENAQIKEETTLADYENEIGEYVEGSRDTVTISKEEYEQLKNNVNLSKEEKVIGTWIDGKKLYSKTIELDFTTQNVQTHNHNIENVDTIYIDAGNTFVLGSDGLIYPFLASGVSNGSFVDGTLILIQNVTKTEVRIRGGENAKPGKAYITLKYTKTTD